MHGMLSIDYAVILTGEILLRLDVVSRGRCAPASSLSKAEVTTNGLIVLAKPTGLCLSQSALS